MRLVLDFIAGAMAGMRQTSCLKGAYSARPRRRGPLAGILARAGLLALAIAIAAAAMFAAGGLPLRSPSPKPSRASASAASPTFVPKQTLDEIVAFDPDSPKREWRYIVLHHSGTSRGSAQSFDMFHRQRNGWRSLGYHFVIGNGSDQGDGVIAVGPRWYSQEAGAHANCPEYNEYGIGICLVGNFDEYPPTPAQLEAARALIRRLCHDYNIPAANVVGHNQVRRGGSTACPGKLFPLAELLQGL
jgi:N-acetyl-anhydromuramyl-L-alanine amidase AmpD